MFASQSVANADTLFSEISAVLRTHRGCFGDRTGVAVGYDFHVRTGAWYRYSYHLDSFQILFLAINRWVLFARPHVELIYILHRTHPVSSPRVCSQPVDNIILNRSSRCRRPHARRQDTFRRRAWLLPVQLWVVEREIRVVPFRQKLSFVVSTTSRQTSSLTTSADSCVLQRRRSTLNINRSASSNSQMESAQGPLVVEIQCRQEHWRRKILGDAGVFASQEDFIQR